MHPDGPPGHRTVSTMATSFGLEGVATVAVGV